MNTLKSKLLPVILMALAVSLHSCKSKKLASKPEAPQTSPVEEVKEEKTSTKTASNTPATNNDANSSLMDKANFKFKNIQFEFNSAVLKTSSYEVLDQISTEIKKVPSAKFVINGHSSAEGTPEHNQSLSLDRANSVKSYLVNSGVDSDNLNTTGYGESKPIAKNDTEASRALNRRVEIKTVK